MRKKRKVTVIAEIEVKHWEYRTKRENDLATRFIKEAVQNILKDQCSFIDLLSVEQKDGSLASDCSSKTKIRVRVNK